MDRIVRGLSLALLVILLGTGAATAQDAAPSSGSPVAGGRSIELPDTRILALSPDGKWIAAGKPGPGLTKQLCVYSVETLAEQSCADLSRLGSGLRMEDIVWSPDSTRLAFGENSFKYFRDGDLWMMDAATGKLTDLTDDGFEGGLPVFAKEKAPATPIYIDILPAWSPDGHAITFSRSAIINGEFKGNQIAQIDLSSGSLKVKTLLPVTLDQPGIVYYGMTWDATGTRLYYSIMYPQLKQATNGVWVYDTKAGTVDQLLKSDPELGPPAIMEINAGGDTGLVFYPIAATQYSLRSDVFKVLDLKSETVSRIDPSLDSAGTYARVEAATFSPDGTQVLFTASLPGRDQVLMRSLSGGASVTVANNLSRVFPPVLGRGLTWATNGTTLVLSELSKGILIPLGAEHSAPAAATPSPAASPAPTTFAPGQPVMLTTEASLHATPSAQGQVVLTLRPGATLIVIGEPVQSGGHTWLPVLEPATGTLGYVDADLVRA